MLYFKEKIKVKCMLYAYRISSMADVYAQNRFKLFDVRKTMRYTVTLLAEEMH